MDEGAFNPRRRYRDFRPRQASRGFKASGVPVNLATIGLYNDSTGPYVLVVRDFDISGTASDNVGVASVHAQIGTSQGLVDPYVSSGARQNGLVASIDTATIYPADYQLNLSSLGTWQFMHDWPFAVIEPGYSLVFQGTVAAHAVNVSLIWESIQIDELDYFE